MSEEDRVIEILRDVFGHDAFRQGQHEVIRSITSGRPTLAVMPTGSGKSLCYQLPAVMFEGTTIVVSPLIALIRDQVLALEQIGVKAASLTSADSRQDRDRAMADLHAGRLSLLYVAPERFKQRSFVEAVTRAPVPLFVIDEAHCISEWGHDFRPDYAKLGEIVARVTPERVACLTATATPRVQQDILANLNLENAETIVTGFDRPNLELSVEETSHVQDKTLATSVALKTWMKDGGSGIVYVATRKSCEEVAAQLASAGFEASAYHAGLSPEQRSRAQDEFQNEEQRVIVATTAFGMGVDKEDVRVVVHYHIPSSPEAYYQEVGRAGRDRLPAGGVLIYQNSDVRYAVMRLESSCPTYQTVESCLQLANRIAAEDQSEGLTLDRLAEWGEQRLGRSARAAVVALERAGDISFEGGRLRASREVPSLAPQVFERRIMHERTKLAAMVGYVQRAACRRRYLVDYFGDERRPDRCGVCDRCNLPDARTLEGDALQHAQMALSCVARMKGRFGRTRVIEVLQGKLTKQNKQAHLDALSTFGLLSDWTKEEISALVDGLLRASLATVTADEYPKLQLTDEGAEALRSRAAIQLDVRLERWGDAVPKALTSRSRKRARREKTEVELDEGALALFESLRTWRAALAKEIAKPAFVVATDALLAGIATARPTSLSELSKVPGIGPAKLKQYGPQIVQIVSATSPSPAG